MSDQLCLRIRSQYLFACTEGRQPEFSVFEGLELHPLKTRLHSRYPEPCRSDEEAELWGIYGVSRFDQEPVAITSAWSYRSAQRIQQYLLQRFVVRALSD